MGSSIRDEWLHRLLVPSHFVEFSLSDVDVSEEKHYGPLNNFYVTTLQKCINDINQNLLQFFCYN